MGRGRVNRYLFPITQDMILRVDRNGESTNAKLADQEGYDSPEMATPESTEMTSPDSPEMATPLKRISLRESPKRIIRNNTSVRLSLLPKDFCVTDKHRQWASEKGYRRPDVLFEAFCDYHLKKGSRFADWDAALRTWIRNDTEKFNGKSSSSDVDEHGVPRNLVVWGENDQPTKARHQ